MATKRLRSMVFPGLTDSYTVPEKLTELEDFNTFAGSSIAIVSDGDTHVIIPADMYVYIHGHETLSDGLYRNISGADIAANATLSSSNVELTSGGGLNQLKTSLNSVSSKVGTSTLNTTAQNLCDAVNELNSKITSTELTVNVASTFTLVDGAIYLLTTARPLNSDTGASLYIIFASIYGSSSILIKNSGNISLSLNNLILNVTSDAQYVTASLMKIT